MDMKALGDFHRKGGPRELSSPLREKIKTRTLGQCLEPR